MRRMISRTPGAAPRTRIRKHRSRQCRLSTTSTLWMVLAAKGGLANTLDQQGLPELLRMVLAGAHSTKVPGLTAPQAFCGLMS